MLIAVPKTYMFFESGLCIWWQSYHLWILRFIVILKFIFWIRWKGFFIYQRCRNLQLECGRYTKFFVNILRTSTFTTPKIQIVDCMIWFDWLNRTQFWKFLFVFKSSILLGKILITMCNRNPWSLRFHRSHWLSI